MRPIAKSGLTLLCVGIVLTMFFAARWLIAAGAFHTVTPVSPGICTVLADLPGPEDIEVDAANNAVFISSSDRRHPSARDGLYVLKLDDRRAQPQRLGGTPADFHPQGISLYRAPDGGRTLMAVNHRSNGRHSIEIFTVTFDGGVAKLAPLSTIASGMLVSPNDIFALGPEQFYVSNDHVTRTAFGRFAEDYLLWAHSDLLYFNGMGFRIAVQRIAFPNGIAVSPDGGRLYVASTAERRLLAFSRENFTGNLTEIGALSLPARPDNLSLDAAGHLIVAAHPSLLSLNSFQADPAKPSPSEVYRIGLDANGAPQSHDLVYANDGRQIGAASVAAITGKRLLIGSLFDRKILDCEMK